MAKKILLFFVVIMLYSCSVFAATREVGVVLFGGSDYKDDHFMSVLSEVMVDDTEKNFKIHVGNDEQSRYQNYWFSKEVLDIPAPTPQSMKDYVAYSGYDEVLFLVVKDPVTDVRKYGLFGTKEEKRVSVEISGYLVSKDSLIGSSTAASEDNSRFSDLRARRGAFKKSVKYIYDSMKNKF